MNHSEWIERYASAWRARSSADVVKLFTPGAVYYYSPTKAPHRGHDEIAAHWKRATSTFSELDLRFGTPISQGRRTFVEMWATLRDPAWNAAAPSDLVTFPGCLVLRFTDEGLCEEHREYYNTVFGENIAAPAGWGD
ncbi:nuclear transport factor 2 family protein [Kineosporia sp. NBRC 101731]|uniref:nuclear transport factor 2 family protein n=1 Tax=Kineosporia sp. NBRC 101731 TaxID=3032199 RepID=UPI0025526EA7|nr:nuclear transport factor 2 family protein [Kineosporia sp. NBRC 101731]